MGGVVAALLLANNTTSVRIMSDAEDINIISGCGLLAITYFQFILTKVGLNRTKITDNQYSCTSNFYFQWVCIVAGAN